MIYRPLTTKRPSQQGISLLELLVGIVISMLTVLAITQVFLASERQRRIPASNADAQTNGVLALDALQRDIRQAGYGLGGGPWTGTCTTTARAEATAVGLGSLPLAPITIMTAGSAGNPSATSDSIDVLSSGKLDAAVQIKLAEDYDTTNKTMVVPDPIGIEANDWVIISNRNGTECDAFQVQSISATAPWKLSHGDAAMRAYQRNSILSNLGTEPIRRRWSVSSAHNLQMTDLTANTPTAADAYPEIVLLRACYTRQDSSGTVTCTTTAPTNFTEWREVIGLRVALVVRSTQFNPDEVTVSAPQWNQGTATPVSLSLEHVTDWKHYRYRLYETLIPLRNLLWNANAS